jgi:uridine monophosphate synthetase
MSWKDEKANLGKKVVLDLSKSGMIKTWFRDRPEGWTLVSGIWSPFYIQLRPLSSHPKLLAYIGYALGRLIKEECENVNKILGVAMAGIPIATAISLSEDIPACFTRKLEGVRSIEDFDNFIKSYGEHSIIEGELANGDVIGIVDDLVTRFGSKLIAIKQLELELKLRKLNEVQYSNVIVLLDREQGAREAAEQNRISLHSLIPFTTKGIEWLRDALSDDEYKTIKNYLENYQKYQDPDVQRELFEMATKRPKP